MLSPAHAGGSRRVLDVSHPYSVRSRYPTPSSVTRYLGCAGLDSSLLRKLAHVHPQIVAFLDMQRTPHLLQQLPVGDDFPCMADERGEKFVFNLRQMNLLVGHKHLTST